MDKGIERTHPCQACSKVNHPALINAFKIKNLIPIVLDSEKLQYSSWSTLFRVTACAYNVLDHIDPTIPTPSNVDTTLWAQLDALVLSWIYATVSTDVLVTILHEKFTAMDAWNCLREKSIFQHKITGQLHKRRRDNSPNQYDFISGLPDDVLVYILSLVGMKAAATTSLVSKRWRHVWTHLTNLDFYDPQTLAFVLPICYAELRHEHLHILSRYVNRVNQVITANQAPVLNTLRILFPLKNVEAPDINKWLEIAFAKKVCNLELDFIVSPIIQFSNIVISTNPASVVNTTLESLSLKGVSVNGPLLQWVLSNCLNLRCLILHGCNCRTTTFGDASKHKGLLVSSLKLEHLEFINSNKILNTESLQIFAPNLTTFKFSGSFIDVEYVSVPSLVDASFEGLYSRNIFQHADIMSVFSSQLEKLSLQWFQVSFATSGFPSFANVKQLELVYDEEKGDGLFYSTCSLIEACPLLHTFKLKLKRWSQVWKTPRQVDDAAGIDAVRAHHHLETIEFVGYAGSEYAARLAVGLTHHAPMLNKFVFDPRQPQYVGEPYEAVYGGDANEYMDRIPIARHSAEVLAKLIPPSVDVVIL